MRFFINNQTGFTIDPEGINPDNLQDIYIPSSCSVNIDFTSVEDVPEYAKDEISYYGDLTGIDGDRKPYTVNGASGNYRNVKFHRSASVFLDGFITLKYTQPRRRR